ncbi:MAG: hypothetical protein O2799_05535 [Planctomycetota bacterium]|nr:hypothetical protein [Planctomycetota bacterium]
MPKPRWGKPPATPRRGRWSTEEIARLRELYGHRTDASIGRELGRTAQAVRRTADSLYEGQELRTDPWTDQDLELLGASDLTALCRVLARGQQEVQDKIAELAQLRRSRPFDLEEVALFKRIYGSRTDEDLAIVFGRPTADISALGTQLCLAKDKAFVRRKAGKKLASKMPRWAAEELDVLRELYPQTPNLEIAKRLGRSVKSVVSKAHALDLKKNPDRLREMGRQNVALRHQRSERS